MVSVLLLKLNGWPETFNERAEAIASHVDELVVIRPKPAKKTDPLAEVENSRVYNLYPQRGSFVDPSWLKPIIFPLHVLQAILLMSYLLYRGEIPSVIHALDYALGGMAGAVVSRLFSVPFVVSVRGLKEPRYQALLKEEQTVRASVNYRILRVMTGVVLRNADHVVTKAKYQVKFVQETFGVDPGFTTVPTGVDFDIFNPKKINDKNYDLGLFNDQLTSNDKVVLYLAKLIPEKGSDKLLQNLSTVDSELHANFKFVFIGEFRSISFEQRFNRMREGLTHRTLIYPDRVPFEDVPKLIYMADAVALLSEAGSEGVPRILQESCAMQTPIIASDVTGITKAFEDLPGCYLIDQNDPQEFKTAVTKALTDPPEMPREQFADRFDICQNYAKYVEAYEDVSQLYQ